MALAFDRAATRAGVGYAMVGGMAVMAWGRPRATADVDVLLSIPPGSLTSFVTCLEVEGFSANPLDFKDVGELGGHVTIFDNDSPFHVDAKIARGEPELTQIASAVEVAFGDGRVRVASPEDTIAFKLLYGSPQDLEDARSIIDLMEKALDIPRLRTIGARLGVTTKLDELLAE
ncbi:MAG: hypothetical protein HY556_11915 [Euryarchaeota archaeon]|nr:hypothetical protein [Euryarchaeota archaeon]